MAGTIVCDNITNGSAQTGSTTDMIKGSARAWVNFNGTGTVAIRASYNVSSITDLGTGDYRVNFTTAMSDVNYCLTGICQRSEIVNNGTLDWYSSSSTTTYARVKTDYGTSTFSAFDSSTISVSVFR